MKTKFILFFCIIFFLPSLMAQENRVLNNVKLINAYSKESSITQLGTKVLVIYYVDPDAYQYSYPVFQRIDKESFSKDKYESVAIINTKDSWVPNWLIMQETKSNQKQNPNSLILIDKEHTFKKNLNLKDCNGKVVCLIIDKNKEVKCLKYLSSKQEAEQIGKDIVKILTEIL